MTKSLTKEPTEIKCLMDTTDADARVYLRGCDDPQCVRCATPFTAGDKWFAIHDTTGAHCARCIQQMQQDTYEWYAAMDDYARMLEEENLDADMRQPSEPMYAMPF